jgi:hypothetical protein
MIKCHELRIIKENNLEKRDIGPYLDLASTPWEDNKLGLVCLKPLDISLQPLKGFVFAAVIHSNANGWGKLLRNASSLRLQYADISKTTKHTWIHSALAPKDLRQRNYESMYHLKLLQGKALPGPRLHVVLQSLALHNGAKGASSWAWEDLNSLLLTSCTQNTSIIVLELVTE